MSAILLQIDGQEVEAQEGMTLLDAAKSAGIYIPTLCHHEKLEEYGGCRICMVEVQKGSRSQLVVACVYMAESGLVVTTRSEKIDRIRKTIIELLLAHAPDSEELQLLGEEYRADRNRFEMQSSFCVHCGLCVRYCAEVKKANAVGFIDRGSRREISFIPELAATECWCCKECFPLCPTSALQAAYVWTTGLLPPPQVESSQEC
jgi:bidirectional [NiFe] hydrogenase diaphorase subunit